MGINRVNNGVTLNGGGAPFGGTIVGLQYSISFQGPSSLSVTIANESGEYGTPVLNSEEPTLISFGSTAMYGLAMSYRKSIGSGGRTMTVTFDDMGTKYLDKNLVLLKHQHLSHKIARCAMVVGKMYESDAQGIQRRSSGTFKSGVTKVQYEVAELATAIREQGIPVAARFLNYLSQFKSNEAFLRTDIGPLRSVLGSIGTDLGFVPFWNSDDMVNESGNTSVSGGKTGEGFLDYIRFESDVDINVIRQTIAKVSSSCNILDSSEEVTLRNSFLKGGIGSFDVNPPMRLGRQSVFERFQFKETITSPYVTQTSEDDDGKTQVTVGESGKPLAVGIPIKDNMGLELLMRAAQMGPEFYKNYVLLKLCCTYMNKLASEADDNHFWTLEERDQAGGEGAEKFNYVSQSIRREMTKAFPGNLVENEAVNALYIGASAEGDAEGGYTVGGALFDLIPTVYSAPKDECWNWRDSSGKGTIDGVPQVPLKEWVGADTRFEDIFQDESFLEELRVKFKLQSVFSKSEVSCDDKGTEVAPSEFIGVAYRKSKAMFEFINNTSDCPVYKEVQWLSENYGRWYSMARSSRSQRGGGKGFKSKRLPSQFNDGGGNQLDVSSDGDAESNGGALISQNVFNTRKYIEEVKWIFSDLAATDTELADIYKFTLAGGKIDYESTASYTMVKAGQSDCGKGHVGIGPTERTLTVCGYECIVGMHRMLASFGDGSKPENQGANATPRKTSCAGSIGSEFTISSVYSVMPGSDYKSFALETMVVRTSRLTNISPGGSAASPDGGDKNMGNKEGGGGGGGDACGDDCLGEGDNGGDDEEAQAGSIPQSSYAFINEYRSNCELTLDSEGVEMGGIKTLADGCGNPPGLVGRSEGTHKGEPISFKYDTDRDYGVLLHKHGTDPAAIGTDVEIGFSHYNKSNEIGATDLWFGKGDDVDGDSEGEEKLSVKQGSAYMALEIIQIGPDEIRTEYNTNESVGSPLATYSNNWTEPIYNAETGEVEEGDHINLDYWDYRLFNDVSLGIKLNDIKDQKLLTYSFTVEDLLQSIRCSYIPNKNYEKVASLTVDPVKFDIGELLGEDSTMFQYPLCEEGDVDLQRASRNLRRIMQTYVDENISPSISRDFVITGFGFGGGYLPSIYEGLESVSLSIGEDGVKTTVKIGNKRRMQASKELRASRVVRGVSGGNSSVHAPNNVTSTFSQKFQTRM